MSGEQRLKRLRELIDHLERLPASAEQERMLREVRARAVDVDTGVTPRAMLPVGPEPTPPPDPSPPPVRRPRAIARTPGGQRRSHAAAPFPRPATVARAVPDEAVPRAAADVASTAAAFSAAGTRAPLLGTDDLLSLDDSAPSVPDGGGERPTFSWTRGLRG